MLALSPPLFSTFEWPFEDPRSHEENYTHRESETVNSCLHLPPSQPLAAELKQSTPSRRVSDDPTMVKKLTHNARERGRRKKINSLYSSLRSLLPALDQKKKLSIPATVTQMLKYIPELQKQVERHTQKKKELLSRISRQEEINLERRRTGMVQSSSSSSSAISASRLGDKEILMQISTFRVQQISLSDVLLNLEEDGLVLVNAASFESLGGKVFYSLHLQVEGTQRKESELLNEKLSSLYERREDLSG